MRSPFNNSFYVPPNSWLLIGLINISSMVYQCSFAPTGSPLMYQKAIASCNGEVTHTILAVYSSSFCISWQSKLWLATIPVDVSHSFSRFNSFDDTVCQISYFKVYWCDRSQLNWNFTTHDYCFFTIAPPTILNLFILLPSQNQHSLDWWESYFDIYFAIRLTSYRVIISNIFMIKLRWTLLNLMVNCNLYFFSS